MATELKTACRDPTGVHRALVLIDIQVSRARAGPIGDEALIHHAFLAAQPWNVRAARYSLMQGDDDDGNRWFR